MSLLDTFQQQIHEFIDAYTQRISNKYSIPTNELKKLLNGEVKSNKPIEIKTHEELLKMTVSEMKELCHSLGLKRPSTKPKLMNELETYYATLPKEDEKKSVEFEEDTIVIKDREVVLDDDDSDISFDESFILDDNENEDDYMEDS